jgi:putative oxidoreductase
MGVLNRYSEPIFLVLRVVAGLMFAVHGAEKFGLLGGEARTGDTLTLVAAIIELVGGLMIALGFFGDLAAFIASGEMAVAYWKVHALGEAGWINPVANKGELAVLYCFLFLYIAARGTGPYSLDRGLRRGRVPAAR